MKQTLHNRVNREELRERLQQSAEPRQTLSFYQYAHLPDPTAFRDAVYATWSQIGVFGRVYVATEGINAQVSVPAECRDAFRDAIYSIPFLTGIRLNWAVEDDGKSFYKLTIKVRDKIVADGIDDPTFDVTQSGQHLDAAAFNALTERTDVVVVDMRNHYESEVGHFRNAVLPDVDTFRDSLPAVVEMLHNDREKPVVMYCTGGIRCEKASAYLKHHGFGEVYQLEGGIIEYARQVSEGGLENKFVGKNFVFDDRLGERITPHIIAHCHQCGAPADTHTDCRNTGCHTLFIQCEACAAKYEGCCSEACQAVTHLSPEDQAEYRRQNTLSLEARYKKGRQLKNTANAAAKG